MAYLAGIAGNFGAGEWEIMNIEKMREEFEAWIKSRNATASLAICTHEEGFRFSVGEYKNEIVHISWIAWQASRESLVIELPESYMDGICESMEADDVRKAIEAAGLKVKL